MQTHTTTGNSLSRILELLTREHPLNRQERQIYDLVMMKNFEIIQTLLTKLNGLYHSTFQAYQENEEYETDFAYLRQKIDNMELSNQNLHHQFRTTSSATDRKLSEHTAIIANINNQIEHLRKEVKEEKWRPYFTDQQKEIEIQNEDILKLNRLREEDRRLLAEFIEKNQKIIDVTKYELDILKKEVQNKQFPVDLDKSVNKSMSNTLNNLDLPSHKTKKALILHKSKSNNTSAKVLFKNTDNPVTEDQLILNPSFAIKNSAQIEQIQKNTAFFEKKVEALSQKMEQKFKQILKQNQQIKMKLSQRVIKSMRQLRSSHAPSSVVSENKCEHSQEIGSSQLKKFCSQIHEQIDYVRFTLNEYLVKLEKDLQKKIDRNTLEKGIQQCNDKIRSVLVQNQQKFANRFQTRRAISFLEDKLNKLYEKLKKESNIPNQFENNQYLKIYKCELSPSRDQMRNQRFESIGIIEPFNEFPTDQYLPLTSIKLNHTTKQQNIKQHFRRLNVNKSSQNIQHLIKQTKIIKNELKKKGRTGSDGNLIQAILDTDQKEWKEQVQKQLGMPKKYKKRIMNGVY